jgi:hypothetical protein
MKITREQIEAKLSANPDLAKVNPQLRAGGTETPRMTKEEYQDFLARNHIGPELAKAIRQSPLRTEGKRVRQSSAPKMNKLEAEWFEIISRQFPNYPRPRAQAKRYRIGNGAWYKPDATATRWPAINGGPDRETAWEVKGPKYMKNVDRGILALKVAASSWPEVQFILIWKEQGVWNFQEVLP